MITILFVTLLSSLVPVTLFAPLAADASTSKDCEGADFFDCTVADWRDYCANKYAGNSAGWTQCMSQTPPPGTGP